MPRGNLVNGFSKFVTIVIVAVPIAAAAYIALYAPFLPPVKYWFEAPKDFAECVKARGEVFFSMPPKCRFHGREFTNDAPMIQKDEVKNASASSFSGSIDTSDWKTYHNEEYGFEVRYPAEFKISEGDALHGTQSIKGILIEHLISTDEGPFRDLALEISVEDESVKSLLRQFDDFDPKPLSLSDKQGFKLETSREGDAGYTILLKKDEKSSFVIIAHYGGGYENKGYYVPSTSDLKGEEYVLVLFDQILSTFESAR